MNKELSVKIRELRYRLGLTQREFGQILGVNRNTVTRWEMGILFPTPGNLAMLQELAEQVGKMPKEKVPEKSVLTKALLAGGMAYGLYKLLQAIYGDRDE